MFYTKYFANKLVAISFNFVFYNKIWKYPPPPNEKNFKTKLARNIRFFISELKIGYENI